MAARSAQTRVVCALVFALVLRPCGGFARFRFVPVAPLPRVPCAHTATPTRLGVGASCVRAGGGRAGLLWACLLRSGGWVALFRVRLLVFALLVLARVCWGWWDSVVPPPLSRLLGWCSRARVGVVGVCWVLRARWAEGCQVGAGQSCPAPYSVACVARLLRGVEERKWVRVLSWCANTCARTRREGDRGGEW